MLQFKLPAEHSVRIRQAWSRALHLSVLLGRAAIFDHKQNYGLQDGPRASCPCGEGGDGREDPTSQLHTFMEGKVELWVGTTRLSFVVFLAAVLTLAAAFFLGFPVASLGVL